MPPAPGAKRRKGTPGSGNWAIWASQPPKNPRNHGGYWGSPHKTMEWGCFRWDQGTGYLERLPTSQHEAAAESSGYMLFVNENFSRVRAELSQAAEEEESVASVAAQTTPSFSSIAKESRGNSGSWNQTFGENMVGKLCMTCCSECWICWHMLACS